MQVFCNFSSGAVKTCVHPINGESSVKTWAGESVWFSKFKGGFKVEREREMLWRKSERETERGGKEMTIYSIFSQPFLSFFFSPSPSLFLSHIKINYALPKSQLQFLRVGSRYASQQFTYNCQYSEAALLFRSQTGKEMKATSTLYDGCQVNISTCACNLCCTKKNLKTWSVIVIKFSDLRSECSKLLVRKNIGDMCLYMFTSPCLFVFILFKRICIAGCACICTYLWSIKLF